MMTAARQLAIACIVACWRRSAVRRLDRFAMAAAERDRPGTSADSLTGILPRSEDVATWRRLRRRIVSASRSH